ncbi:unnamed protein product [Prorocentrum cordatum]|uniref:Uncharacterized protein n=1 Tax=Prorocentrum cordatum TaxID=2364126 RepID=A0ABN9VJ77_9DINO|nr:unnamed protein product [Polarella glacialis]
MSIATFSSLLPPPPSGFLPAFVPAFPHLPSTSPPWGLQAAQLSPLREFLGGQRGDSLAERHEAIHSDADRQISVRPHTSSPHDFRRHDVARTGLPIFHASFLAALQDRTTHEGLIADGGYEDASDDGESSIG